MTSTGPVPTSPSTLQADLIAGVEATDPGYTANLPGSLIEDISSTSVGALTTIDQARVDAVNNLSPYSANPWLLAQLGVQAGLQQGQPTNTSVYVTITGPAGYVIPQYFLVGDGTYQYALQDAAVIPTSGTTPAIYAVATQSGTWSVGAGTVTHIITSVPTGYTLTVTNPQAGVPATTSESVQSYRSRVLQAGKVAGQGTPDYIKALISNIAGVTPRLVTILQVSSGWEVICGGGDPYQVAGAIYLGTLQLSSIVGSTTTGRNITATLTDAPNSYSVTYVNPPQQVVILTASWNTTLPNFTGASQVNSLGATALQSYINSIPVGQPINELEMTASFQTGVASVLPSQYLTTLTFTVNINGTVVAPTTGTSIIPGDPESYFYTSNVTVSQA